MNVWQLVFLVAAAAYIALEGVRGMFNGVVRQAVQLVALAAAWWAGSGCASLVAPHLKPIGLPDFMLPAIGGLGIAILVYIGIAGIGSMLFRKTTEQKSLVVQALYGAGGGALGLVWGGVIVWIAVLGIRLLGTVAQAEIEEARRDAHKSNGALVSGLATAKDAIDRGAVGTLVHKVDPVPEAAYDLLSKIARMLSTPGGAERFLSYPAASAIAEHPMITAMREDPSVMSQIQTRNYLALLWHPAVVEAANDPEIKALVSKFDLNGALDHALTGDPSGGTAPGETPPADPAPRR